MLRNVDILNNGILMMYKLLTQPGIQMGSQCKPLPAPPCGYTPYSRQV